ncbi:probable G-protein coupled receptor 101 [Clupea harengus]|uniref:Probable G-protein coupled receptor 101 n=1 Tax=Clupea harengus TaxID=7950 RepID=A0A6P3WD30_CLUHA|nr:probable G-protein coupled receptor 101 [Clupea harengus]
MPTLEAPREGFANSSTAWGPWGDWGPTTVNSTVKMVLISAIVCTSLFGNVVVLLVFQRKPQLLHVANRFVLNLLLADLLQTVLVMPFAIAAAAPGVWPLDARLCQALVVLMHLFAFTGVNTIMVVSVDRYLAIIHPLSYPTRMTPHLGTNLIALTWLLSVLQSTPPLYGWGAIEFDRHHNACTVVWSSSYSYSALVSALSFWLPVLIMLGCYWMVFRAARRQNALVHPIQANNHLQPPESQASCSSPQRSQQQPSSQQQQQQQPSHPDVSSAGYPIRVRHRRFHYHCKAARVVFVIMASYIVSMGPYSVLSTVATCSSRPVPPWLSSLALILFFLQCCLHPYIYGYMHRSVRKEFLALLCGSICRPGRPGRGSAVDSCFTVTDGRLGHPPTGHPSQVARVRPLRTWEEGTVSSSSPTDRRSRDSRKETTSISLSSERELTVHSK